MCTTCATPAAVAARITRRVPSTFTRRSCSGCRPGCSAQARWTTASAPSRNRARTCSLAASPRSARCHRTSRYGATSGGCRRARPRISFTPVGSALSRRSSAVPTLPVAPVMATVRPGRWELGSSAMLLQLPVPSAGNRCRRPRAGRRLRPVIRGAHLILYSSDAEADRALLADLLDLPAVDAGGGWLILQLPPAEVAVHPAETAGATELYLVCDDLDESMGELTAKGVTFDGPVSEQRWGRLASIVLPGGGRLGIYEARHPTAFDL